MASIDIDYPIYDPDMTERYLLHLTGSEQTKLVESFCSDFDGYVFNKDLNRLQKAQVPAAVETTVDIRECNFIRTNH